MTASTGASEGGTRRAEREGALPTAAMAPEYEEVTACEQLGQGRGLQGADGHAGRHTRGDVTGQGEAPGSHGLGIRQRVALALGHLVQPLRPQILWSENGEDDQTCVPSVGLRSRRTNRAMAVPGTIATNDDGAACLRGDRSTLRFSR